MRVGLGRATEARRAPRPRVCWTGDVRESPGGSAHATLPDSSIVGSAAAPSRRDFLHAGAAGAIGLTLGDLVAAQARAAGASPLARSVILIWLWGGPSHLDTFDMKPDAPIEYRGPFEPIATAVPGLTICELLPGLARCADSSPCCGRCTTIERTMASPGRWA